MKLYEGMFLLDNDLVRAGWKPAKAIVTDLLEKHGAKLQTARHWAERKLAYKIKRRLRATYLLTYFELDPAQSEALNRSLELNEHVLRHLIVSAEEVPEPERELARAEEATDFSLPEPPSHDAAPEPEPRSRSDERGRDSAGKRKDEAPKKDEAPAEKGGKEDAPAPEAVGASAKPDGGESKPDAEKGA